jgi:hypothetical protein
MEIKEERRKNSLYYALSFLAVTTTGRLVTVT